MKPLNFFEFTSEIACILQMIPPILMTGDISPHNLGIHSRLRKQNESQVTDITQLIYGRTLNDGACPGRALMKMAEPLNYGALNVPEGMGQDHSIAWIAQAKNVPSSLA